MKQYKIIYISFYQVEGKKNKIYIENIVVENFRNYEKQEIKLIPNEIKSKDTGIYFGKSGEKISTKVIALYPNSPAEKQGIQVNDVIVKVNNENVNNDPYKVIELINKVQDDENVIFTINRKGEEKQIEVTPQIVSNCPIGVTSEVV